MKNQGFDALETGLMKTPEQQVGRGLPEAMLEAERTDKTHSEREQHQKPEERERHPLTNI